MRKLILKLAGHIGTIWSRITFPLYKKFKSGEVYETSDNLQVKIIRVIIIIVLFLLAGANYHLIFHYNSYYSFTPIFGTSLSLEESAENDQFSVRGIDTSEMRINFSNNNTMQRYLHLSIRQGKQENQYIYLTLNEHIPVEAKLSIKARSYLQQIFCKIELFDSKGKILVPELKTPWLFIIPSGKGWTEQTVSLSWLKQFHNNDNYVNSNSLKNNISKIKFSFYSDSNTALDIEDISFTWAMLNWPEIIIMSVMILAGLVLLFRTGLKSSKFFTGFDAASTFITARIIYFILALTVFVSAIVDSFVMHSMEEYVVFMAFLLMICFDEFCYKNISNNLVWSSRYALLIVASWLLKISDSTFILAPLSFAVFIPVILTGKRRIILYEAAALLALFLIINNTGNFLPNTIGVLIIVAVFILAVVIKEILFYELLRTETIHAKFLYENLFENSYDGIYITDEEGLIKTANYGFGNMLGFPSDEMTGKSIFDFVVREDHHLVKQLMDEAVLRDFNMCDINFTDINGGIHTSLIRLVAIYKNNSLIGYQSIATDITERKHSEQELWKSQSRYKALLAAIPDTVLKFKRDGTLIDYHVQDSAEITKGYEKLIGKNICNIFEPNLTQYFLIHADNAFKKKLPQIFEYENNINDMIQYNEARIVPVQNDNFIVIIRDITERRLAEYKIQEYLVELDDNRVTLEKNTKELAELNSKLEDINKSKDKFFSIVAHDLRSPFTGLLGFSDILSTQIECLTTDEIKTYAAHLNHSLKNVFKLLENLLDWSRMQTGKIKFDPSDFNLNELIQRIAGIFQMNASDKKIDLELIVEPELFTYADKDMVDIVIRNLLSNSIKFTKPGGRVSIEAARSNSHVEITISDNGIGILPENLNKLFRIDENISTDGTAREKGTGLGLILCKEFIEKNKGYIRVESKVNEGSKFIFTLPAVN